MQNDALRRQTAANLAATAELPGIGMMEAGEAGSVFERATEAMDGAVHQIDDLDLPRFLEVAGQYGQSRYGYVVTPNVDHLIRCIEDPSYRALYRTATFVLLDSRFAAHLFRVVKGLQLPVCPGADLFPELLKRVVAATDRLVLIGGTSLQAEKLAARYGLKDLRHHNPPMGFIKDPLAVQRCLQFIEEASPFRFCFLAIGAPQQEQIAYQLMLRRRARGLALCLGASLNFITDVERRAPTWMRRIGSEWLFRLLQDPRRLGTRYLIRGPRIFGHLGKMRIVLRPASPTQA